MAACGGSGSGSSHTVPTIQETVAAVEGASTPSEGQFAYFQVLSNVGATASPVYGQMSAEDRQQLAAAFGERIANYNASPSDATYSDSIDGNEQQYEITVNDATVIAQLNADFAAAPSNPNTPGRKSLLLLAALEGTGATPGKPITPVGGLLFCRWFATRYGTAASPITRGACEDGCNSQLQDDLQMIEELFCSEAADLMKSVETGETPANHYPILFEILKGEIEQGKEAAQLDFDACMEDCHEQGQ